MNAKIKEIIKITSTAAARVYELISLEDNFTLKLRVYVVGGGCSGFQYGFAFDEKTNPNDEILEIFFNTQTKEILTLSVEDSIEQFKKSDSTNYNSSTNTDLVKLSIVIDPISINYLLGAELNYIDDLNGSRFVVSNPNASTTCSCGSSFAV